MSRQLITAKREQLLRHLFDAKGIFPTIPVSNITDKIIETPDLYIAYSTQEPGKLSYAPAREFKYDAVRRQMTTFGRIVRRQLEKDESFNIKDSDLDKIQRYLLYKLGVTKCYKNQIKVLTGDAILDAYAGNVGCSSCMTGWRMNKYLDLYSTNPEKIALLVVETPDGTFRALRWLLDNGKYVYDRPFPTYDSHENTLRELAVETGGYFRAEIQLVKPQKNTDIFSYDYRIELSELNKDLKVTVNKPRYLPYRDTFYWFRMFNRKKYMELTLSNFVDFYNYRELIGTRSAVRYYNRWKYGR